MWYVYWFDLKSKEEYYRRKHLFDYGFPQKIAEQYNNK